MDSTLVYYPPDEYKDLAPYTSVLVQLDNGCRLFAIIKGEHRDIDPGSPVTLVDKDEGRGAMFFQLDPEAILKQVEHKVQGGNYRFG